MAGNRAGVVKGVAARLGLAPADYEQRMADGQKRCRKCQEWQPTGAFGRDAARGDGLATICTSCRSRWNRPGPNLAERKVHRESGEAWCRVCKAWLPMETVHAGRCRVHAAQEARERYAIDLEYRAVRRQRVHARKRRVWPLPADGIRVLIEEFEGRCAYCGGIATTWDHIIPVAKGGQTIPSNIVPACRICNSSKRTRDVDIWLAEKGYKAHDLFYERRALLRVLLRPN